MSQKRLKNAKLRRSLHISEAPNWTMVKKNTYAKKETKNDCPQCGSEMELRDFYGTLRMMCESCRWMNPLEDE